MRTTRSTGALAGTLIAILGIWGALIPFVGPYFNYSFGTNSTWHYTTDRLWLCIIPGAVAFLGGLVVIGAASRKSGIIGGCLALLAGAWFAIGPAISLTWEPGRGPIGAPLFGSTRQALELLGYFYGLGAAIAALAAFAIGRFVSQPRPATEERALAPAAAAPADGVARTGRPGPEAPERRAETPARRSGLHLPRRRRPAPERAGVGEQ